MNTTAPVTETVTETPADQYREKEAFSPVFEELGGPSLSGIFVGLIIGISGIAVILSTLLILSDRGQRTIFQLINSRDQVHYINNALKLAGFEQTIGFLGKEFEIFPGVKLHIAQDHINFELPKIDDPRNYAFIVKGNKVRTSTSLDRLVNKLQVIQLYLNQKTKS